MYQGSLEPISNRADWFGTVEIINDDTDEPVANLDDVVVSIAIRKNGCSPVLTARTGDGKVSVIAEGIIQWHFTPNDLSRLCAGTYEIGITIKLDDITDQELVATIGIIDGVVRQ
jgi:hypothetical protein